MTLAAAYGRDCLSITLGDGDEEKFMDNVRGCVRPPAGSQNPHPLFCCALWKKLIKTGCKWRWAVGDEHVGVEQWSGKSKYTRPQRESWQKRREGRPPGGRREDGIEIQNEGESEKIVHWITALLYGHNVYFLTHWFKHSAIDLQKKNGLESFYKSLKFRNQL